MANPHWAVIVRIDESRLRGAVPAGAVGPSGKRICVSPVSSGGGECGLLGVGGEGWVGDVGECAFEESDGFLFG